MFSKTVLACPAKFIPTSSNRPKSSLKTVTFQGENLLPSSEKSTGISSEGHLGVQSEQEE